MSKSDREISLDLDRIFSDPDKSEALFDAYRAVCLSRSKTVGPRIIAVLVAEILLARMLSNGVDDLIFAAAEELLDVEFADFESFVRSNEIDLQEKKKNSITQLDDGSLQILVDTQSVDSNSANQAVQIGPLDLARDIGNWAPKLNRLGLIFDDVSEEHYDYGVDTERHVDMPGTIREISWTLTLSPAALKLASLIRIATPVDD